MAPARGSTCVVGRKKGQLAVTESGQCAFAQQRLVPPGAHKLFHVFTPPAHHISAFVLHLLRQLFVGAAFFGMQLETAQPAGGRFAAMGNAFENAVAFNAQVVATPRSVESAWLSAVSRRILN